VTEVFVLFSGSMVALVTPMKQGRVDESALTKLIDWQIENGTAVIVPCGTTGESATLTHEEHDVVIRLTVEAVRGRAKVLAGAGSNSTAEALRLHKFCEKIGVDGALHITPYYNKPTQAGLLAHFRAISESSPLPIVLYNVPSRTGVNLLPETVLRLAELSNIVGVKEASGNLNTASEILKSAPAAFGLYSGEDSLNYPLFALGAAGAISVTCNVVPKLCSEQFSAVQKGHFSQAKKIHYDLYELNRVLFIETNPIPVKAALHMMGRIEEEYRLPLVKMGQETRHALQSVLQTMQLVGSVSV